MGGRAADGVVSRSTFEHTYPDGTKVRRTVSPNGLTSDALV